MLVSRESQVTVLWFCSPQLYRRSSHCWSKQGGNLYTVAEGHVTPLFLSLMHVVRSSGTCTVLAFHFTQKTSSAHHSKTLGKGVGNVSSIWGAYPLYLECFVINTRVSHVSCSGHVQLMGIITSKNYFFWGVLLTDWWVVLRDSLHTLLQWQWLDWGEETMGYSLGRCWERDVPSLVHT